MKSHLAGNKVIWVVAVLLLLALLAVFVMSVWVVMFARAFLAEPCEPQPRQIVESTLSLTLEWEFTADECFWRSPTYQSKRIVGRTDNTLVVLDADTGAPLLKFPAGSSGPDTGFPTFENLLVFTSDAGKQVNVLDLQDATLRWSQRPGGLLDTGTRSAAIDEQGVYITSGEAGGKVLAFDANSGEPLWQNPSVGHSSGSILNIRGDELLIHVTNSLYELDKKTGKELSTLQNTLTAGKAEVVGDRIYSFPSQSFRAQDLDTGAILWEFNEPAKAFIEFKDRIILTAQSKLFPSKQPPAVYGLEAGTGEMIWRRELVAEPIGNPVVIGEKVYLLLNDASIVSFDAMTGEPIGALRTEPARTRDQAGSAGLATDGVNLFVTFGDKQVFAFGP